MKPQGMISLLLKRITLFLVFIGLGLLLKAQNLVPNYSFDTISMCPDYYGGVAPLFAPPWDGPTFGTPDIFNVCATFPDVGVPINFFGTQIPLTGEGYGGFFCYFAYYEYREYIMAQLLQPLTAGTYYNVSFYVSLSEFYDCGVTQIGAFFSEDPPWQTYVSAMNVVPQVESDQGFLTDTEGWTLISGCLKAQGGEEYITLGNFHTDADTPLSPSCTDEFSYYYIENVTVEAVAGPAEIPLELGDPVTACLEYEIDPGLSGYYYHWENGNQGPTLTVTESGTYSLTITSDGCNYGIDSIEVTILTPLDPLDIGPPQDIFCVGGEYSISLDPTLSEYTWQDGSHGPEYSITTPGTYSVTLDDGCNTTSDIIVIDVMEPPVLDLGDDINFCAGDEVIFSLDPLLGDYIWHDGSTSSYYSASDEGTYTVTVSNICGSSSDEIILTELDVPLIELGLADQTICTGDTLFIVLDPGSGNIHWQDASNSLNYEITTPGVYSVTVSNDCGSGSDLINVTGFTTPVVDLGPDTILCSGETILLAADSIIASYLWQDTSTANTFLVSSPGLYFLTIANQCGIVSDSVTINYSSAISPLDFGPDQTLCTGGQVSLHANSPGANYLWQDNSTADSFQVTVSGTYFLQISNTCSSVADTIVVTIEDNPPQVDLPDQLSLCQGEFVTLDALITGVSYLWNDNSQNQQLQVTTPGIYSVTASDSCGSSADTTIVLNGGPAPTIALGNDIQLCSGESILLVPTFSDVNSWVWQDGSTAPTFSVTHEGQIHVAVNNSCGNAYDTLQVTLLPAIPLLDLGVDTSLCSGESFTLTINTPGVNILWPDGSTTPDYTTSGTGSVFASITNSCGQSFDTMVISALPDVADLNLGPDQSLCPGEIISLSPGIANVQYLWQDGSTANTYQSTREETIILTISNECGTSTDTLEVTESTLGPQLDLGQDIQVCAGEIVIIESDIAGVNYLWQDGSTGSDYTTGQSGVFILEVSNNCGSATDTIIVTYLDAPDTFTLGPDATLCPGETQTLYAPATSYTILWQDGSDQTSLVANQAGTYSLQISNACGSETDELVVEYDYNIPQLNLTPSISLCPGDLVTLDATQPFPAVYSWSTGATSPAIQILTPGVYTIDVGTTCSMASLEVDVLPGVDCIEPDVHNDIYIPNVFSPNDDGINDVFAMSFGSDLQVTAMTGSIFDRWGNLMYSSEAIPFQWDGLYANDEVLPGVYVYHIKCTYLEGSVEREEVFAGDVTLVK